MATVDELLAKLEERFILGEISEETYKDLLAKLRARSGSSGATTTPGGLRVQDSVIKGDISNISAGSIGNFNLHVGTSQKDGRAEIQYEQFVLTVLQSGGEIEKSRDQLDAKRQELGLTLRIAQDLEVAAAAERKRQASRVEPSVIITCAGKVSDASFSDGGRFAVMAFDDGTARVWDVLAARETWQCRLGGYHHCISSDGMLLAFLNFECVEVWESTREGPRLRWRTESVDDCDEEFDSSTDFCLTSPCDVSFSPDLKWLAVADECLVGIFDVKTGHMIKWPIAGSPATDSIRFDAGYSWARCRHQLEDSNGAYCVRFTPDGSTLLLSQCVCNLCLDERWERLGYRDKHQDKIAENEHKERVEELQPDGWAPVLLSCAAGGRHVLLAWGSFMQFFGLSRQHSLFTLEGQTGTVHSVDLSPDAHYAATAAEDRTFRIWCLQTRRCVRCENADVKCVRFTADGRSVLTIESDGVVRQWPLDGL